MKIFILPTSYPDTNHPSRNLFIYEQGVELEKLGHNVVVLNVNKLPTSSILKKIDSNIRFVEDKFGKRYIKNIKTFWENRFPDLNKNEFVDAMTDLFVYAQQKEGTPDILYAHFSCWAGYAGTFLSQKFNIPLVTLEHGSSLIRKKIPKSILSCLQTTIANSEQFACVSQGLKNSISQKLKTKKELLVISNMIDSRFCFFEQNKKDKFVFLAIGNLHKHKGFKELINAFCIAFSNVENVNLHIGGDGPEYRNLKTLIQNNHRENQIVLLGRLTREQTIAEYISCNCFVLPSKFETFGLVYREALATGRPIITTDHGGFDDGNWHDEYGYKIPVDDNDALEAALQKMVIEYDRFDKRKISELCLKDCSADVIGKQIENILISAVKTYSSRDLVK